MILKFQPKKYLMSLQKGCLYMNTKSYFKKVDTENSHLYDKFEDINVHFSRPQIRFYQNNAEIVSLNNIQEASVSNPNLNKYTHIWCCFHIKSGMQIRSDGKLFDEKMWAFGDHVLAIANVKEFERRVIKALVKHKILFEERSVDYRDKTLPVNSDMNIFTKFNEYNYQNEFRLAIQSQDSIKANPFELNIGSIEDISIILHKYEIKNLVRQSFDKYGPISIIELA